MPLKYALVTESDTLEKFHFILLNPLTVEYV